METIKQQLILTIVSMAVGLLLGGFLVNRMSISEQDKKIKEMEVKWEVMLMMSSTEAKQEFLRLVKEKQ